MDTTGFIKYTDILKTLEDNAYRGFTASRVSKNRIRRTFVSYKWYTIDIAVETLKLEGENIVIKIEFNGEEVNGVEDFRRRIEGISRVHSQKRKQETR
jgi:hypothetical protein